MKQDLFDDETDPKRYPFTKTEKTIFHKLLILFYLQTHSKLAYLQAAGGLLHNTQFSEEVLSRFMTIPIYRFISSDPKKLYLKKDFSKYNLKKKGQHKLIVHSTYTVTA